MATYYMYGIKNCDTIKKARRWLAEHGIDYRFHDYRADGLNEELLMHFINTLGWEAMLNTRGTTWRKLSDEQKAAASDVTGAKALMLAQPAIIKRPLLVKGNAMLLGFSASNYQQFTSGA